MYLSFMACLTVMFNMLYLSCKVVGSKVVELSLL